MHSQTFPLEDLGARQPTPNDPVLANGASMSLSLPFENAHHLSPITASINGMFHSSFAKTGSSGSVPASDFVGRTALCIEFKLEVKLD